MEIDFPEAATEGILLKKVFLKISKLHRNTTALDSLLIRLKAGNFIKKETQAQTFSCEICEIFKTPNIQMHMWATNFLNPAYLFSLRLANFIRFNINRLQRRYFFKFNALYLIWCSHINYVWIKKCFFSISINILIKFLLKICALLGFCFTPGGLDRYVVARGSSFFFLYKTITRLTNL